ncbi:Nnf1-domain-containing protein [Viridothelium virens]|uniref:Nnf1-domain-containing protein n=1 Tax=Viridothelium virens TaxID=1048519 RepID=A0A6A6GY92_VIRVR|nr:Nnf1-domain-containing protein [Viridothelium virens]
MPSAAENQNNEDPQPQSTIASRSPSPAPPAPLANAPGPRATALQKIFNDALQHTLDTCSYKNFSGCFPTAAKYAGVSLEALWRDFIERLGGVCRQEFDAILSQRHVVPSLNDLDRLIADAKRRKEKALEESGPDGVQPPIPPHTLSPETLLQTHLTPFLNTAQQDLKTNLADTQDRNTALIQEIEGQRKEIDVLMQGLENVVRDLEGSVAALNSENGFDEMTRAEMI